MKRHITEKQLKTIIYDVYLEIDILKELNIKKEPIFFNEENELQLNESLAKKINIDTMLDFLIKNTEDFYVDDAKTYIETDDDFQYFYKDKICDSLWEATKFVLESKTTIFK